MYIYAYSAYPARPAMGEARDGAQGQRLDERQLHCAGESIICKYIHLYIDR